MNNNTTKRFPGNRSKKISKNVINHHGARLSKGRRKLWRGKKGALETKQNVFDERGKKREFKREFKREREFKAHLDDDGGLDGLHFIVSRERD